MDARDIQICIGPEVVAGRLPLMGDRERVVVAHAAALGWRPGDRETPSGDVDAQDCAYCEVAALGLCWPGLEVPRLRDLSRDVVALGEHVYDALRSMGYGGLAILEAARAVYRAMSDSIPTEREVQAALDPTAAPAGLSTSATS